MKKIALIIITMISLSFQLEAKRLYVNSEAQGLNNGSSWDNAFNDLQRALEKIKQGDELWVAKGIYYPTEENDRNATFKLIEDITIYGGFDGSESELAQRSWEKNETILSGNIGDKDSNTDNVMHVVSTANNTVLDGFIIEDGYAMGSKGSGGGNKGKGGSGGKPQTHTSPQNISQSSNTNAGAGILIFKNSATIRNTTIRNCSAGKGGGIYNMTNTSTRPSGNAPAPVFINVKVENNYAMMRGGGMQNDMGTSPLLINCHFTQNECGAKGGALYNDFTCSPIIIGCTFENNKAHDAAAMGNDGSSSPIIIDTKIVNNVVESQGAGLFQGSYNANMRGKGNMPLVINSIVKDNHSTTNGSDNVTNWGEDWIYAWKSEIDGFEHSIDILDAKYDDLVKMAKEISSLNAADIDRLYTQKIKAYLNSNAPEKSSRQKGQQGFGTDNTLSKTANIPQQVIYVDTDAKGGNGTSWPDAYNNLQDAINKAYSSGGGEVWVAAGEYKPTATTKRNISFMMKEGVAIYGGFVGNEKKKSERNIQANPSILSGNIGKTNSRTDNSYHVVLGSINSIIDGFTISDGYADGEITNRFGGGLYCWGYESSTIVKNTIFTQNYAEDGGAVFCFSDVLSYFENVEFKENTALLGGAAAFRFGSSCELYQCTFSNNTAASRGGAMVINYGANVIINESTFSNNTTPGNGGAIWVDDQASQYGGTSPIITKCTFIDNKAQHYGGAIHNYNIATTEINDCSFSGNEAEYGNDIANTLRCQVIISGHTTPDIYNDNTSRVKTNKSSPSKASNNKALTLDNVDFSVTIIGSGSPTYNPERSEPSALIQYKGTKILVDMGNGTKSQLEKIGLSRRNAPDALFLTHHHIDHNDEFISIVHDKLMTKKEFLVAGPAPIDEMTTYAAKFYEEDLNYRMSGAGRSFDADNINASIKVLEGGEQFKYNGLTISTLEVPHSIKTLAYRFEAEGKSIVITGDLTYTTELQKLARGADIMVIDGKTSSGRTTAGNTQRKNASVSAHASIEDIAKMAVESNPKNLVLTHLGTQKINVSATEELYRNLGYKGNVIISQDLLAITPEGKSFMVEKQEEASNSTQQKTRNNANQNTQSRQQSSSQNNPMERFDTNGDNKISKTEAKGPMSENFDRIDTDSDGYVSADELENRRQRR